MREIRTKEERWDKIRWLISHEKISTQNELSRRLLEEGFPVTQATVSRDIRLLRLVKAAGPDGGYYYEASGSSGDVLHAEKFRSIYRTAVLGTAHAANIAVIRCRPGMAAGVCAIVDEMKLAEVLGSIAGDDTIMIVAATEQAAARVADELRAVGEG